MNDFVFLLLTFLIVCAVAVCLTKSILASIIVFMGYSLVMSVIWLILESPDLAVTEAAVGAGVTGVLFFVTIRRTHVIDEEMDEDE